MQDKIKVMVISDHPLSPSGVANQTRYMIEGLLETGKFQFVCLGGAIRHNDYSPTKTHEWGDDFIIFPVDGYGNEGLIRSFLREHRPDILWFMTDPRFYEWLWAMENEIRSNVPMVYYHVWDNYPYPTYNKKYYDSNDAIVTISKLTDNVVENVAPDVLRFYIPHSVDSSVFKKIDNEHVEKLKGKIINPHDDETPEEKFVCFWNNRNARRKQSGTLMFWFKEFLDKVGHENATLLMHTDPKDPNGQDLELILEKLNLKKGQIMLSPQKVEPFELAMLYNIADCTINISDAEGFGLATLESLFCETPIVVNMTGGLQDQVTDGENWFGIGLEPASKAIIGSQNVPYIYEDRLNKDDFIDALEEMYNKWKDNKESYEKIGKMGREFVMKNFSFENYHKQWEEALLEIHEKFGSWENRKGYTSWKLLEVGAKK